MGDGANALSDGNSITNGLDRNAIAHTHTSAEITYEWGAVTAEVLGNFKEVFPDGSAEKIAEQIKDQYNNEVGRRIGEWARDHGYPKNAIDDLVVDAYKTGEIISTLSDPRILSGNSPDWNNPSANWRGSSAGRIPATNPNQSNIDSFLDYLDNLFGSPGDATPVSDALASAGQWFGDSLHSPLVFDLGGQGLDLLPLSGSPTFFDFDGDLFKEQTGWAANDNAIDATPVGCMLTA